MDMLNPLDKLALLLLCDAFGLTDLPDELDSDTSFLISSGHRECDSERPDEPMSTATHWHSGLRIIVKHPEKEDLVSHLEHPRMFDSDRDAQEYADGWAQAFIQVLTTLGVVNKTIDVSFN